MFQNKTISALLIVSLMLFSFAPQTVYAGGVVNAVVDVVSSIVDTVVEVVSNPVVLSIIASVALAYIYPGLYLGEFGSVVSTPTGFAPFFGIGPALPSFYGAVIANTVVADVILCVTEIAFCGGDDDNNSNSNNSNTSSGIGANSAKSNQLTSISKGTFGLKSANCSTSGCECYGPTNSCGKAYQGNIEGDGNSAVCKANGTNLATYEPPSESSCANVPKTTLSANPSVIDNGQASTLTWSSSNGATSCKWAGGFSNLVVGSSGSTSTGALTQSSTYQITCSNSSETSAPTNATITVLNPDVVISAEPTRVRINNSSTIKWGAKDVKSCSVTTSAGNTLASGNSNADYAFSTGSPASVAVATQTIYTITCQTNGDPITKSVTVNVVPLFEEF